MLDFRQLCARFVIEKVALGHVLSGTGARLIWHCGTSYLTLGHVLSGTGARLIWHWGTSYLALGQVLSGTGTRLIPCQYNYHFAPYSYFIHRPSIFPPPHAATTPSGPGLPNYRGFKITLRQTHTHTPSVGVLWTSGQADEETST
jgi:hypothetical protein